MVIEILYPEVCGLYGDAQNATYLQATLPDAQFVFTPLTQRPYFADAEPDMIYIGAMSENTQRRVIETLRPLAERICQLVDKGTVILATGNAGEIFCRHIDYITERKTAEGLGIFDADVKTDLFDRYNGKVLGQFEDIQVVGFRSQFSFLYADNTENHFLKCIRGDGLNRQSKLEGLRKNNLFCTQLLGPILPLNPPFCKYLLKLLGSDSEPAFLEAAMSAYDQRIREFSDPATVFGQNK